jgi:hypothetical protein
VLQFGGDAEMAVDAEKRMLGLLVVAIVRFLEGSPDVGGVVGRARVDYRG